MKISENQILVRQLESNRVQSEESELYGVAGRIAILKSENDLLTGKSNELLRTINRVKKDLVHAPYQIEVSEDLKKKSEIEYLRFRELSSALEKLEAAKMSIDARFEVLEKARMESTYPKTSLSVIFMVVFLLSQAFGFVVIYIRFLIHPEKLALASGSLQQFEGSFENEFQLLGKTNKRPEQRADFLN